MTIAASSCVFCRIVAGESEASVIWQDDDAMALMNLRGVNKGDCMVIPREELDRMAAEPAIESPPEFFLSER